MAPLAGLGGAYALAVGYPLLVLAEAVAKSQGKVWPRAGNMLVVGGSRQGAKAPSEVVCDVGDVTAC